MTRTLRLLMVAVAVTTSDTHSPPNPQFFISSQFDKKRENSCVEAFEASHLLRQSIGAVE
jgi:hypothetical protein